MRRVCASVAIEGEPFDCVRIRFNRRSELISAYLGQRGFRGGARDPDLVRFLSSHDNDRECLKK